MKSHVRVHISGEQWPQTDKKRHVHNTKTWFFWRGTAAARVAEFCYRWYLFHDDAVACNFVTAPSSDFWKKKKKKILYRRSSERSYFPCDRFWLLAMPRRMCTISPTREKKKCFTVFCFQLLVHFQHLGLNCKKCFWALKLNWFWKLWVLNPRWSNNPFFHSPSSQVMGSVFSPWDEAESGPECNRRTHFK